MSQQINLYSRQFAPVHDPLRANRLIGIVVAAVLLLAGLWAANAWRMQQLRSDVQHTRTMLADRQAILAERSRAAAIPRVDPQLARDLRHTEALYQARVELMKLLESGALGTPTGFSEQMGAFARQGVDGLWLTGLSLSSTRVELTGRARSSELVPAYLVRLGQEKVLSGLALNSLRIGNAPGTGDAGPRGGGRAHNAISAAGASGGAEIEFLASSDSSHGSREELR